MLISDSLSFGMRDALKQDCAGEVTFVTACKFETADELEEIIERYLECYWTKCSEAADATRKAFAEGRIIVPRSKGCCAPIGSSGHQIYASFEAWRDEVAEHAPNWSMGWCHHSFRGQISREQVLATENIEELIQLFKRPEWEPENA